MNHHFAAVVIGLFAVACIAGNGLAWLAHRLSVRVDCCPHAEAGEW